MEVLDRKYHFSSFKWVGIELDTDLNEFMCRIQLVLVTRLNGSDS